MKLFSALFRGDSKTRINFLLVLPVLIILSSYILLAFFHNQEKIKLSCETFSCHDEPALNKDSNFQHFEENFRIQFRINGMIADKQPIFRGESHEGTLTFSHESGGILIMRIPMANQLLEPFAVKIPVTNKNKKLALSIFNSREFIVTLDDQLVYSHRYLSPIFKINPRNIWDSQLVSTKGELLLTSLNIEFEYSIHNNSQTRFLYSFIIILFLLVSWIFKKLFDIFLPQKRNKVDFGLPLSAITLVWGICLCLWLITTVDVSGSGHPSPFGPIGNAFSDMMQIFQAGKFQDPYIYSAVNYPPLSLAIVRLIPFLSVGIIVFAITVMSLSLLWWLASSIDIGVGYKEKIIKFFTFAFPYPVLFSIVRGNLDLLASVLVGLSALLINREKFKSAGLLLGFAICLKVWPAVFLLYFLSRKNFKGIAVCLGSGLLLTFCSFWILGYFNPKEQFSLLKNTLGYFNGAPSSSTFIYSYSFSALIFVGLLVVNRYINHFDITRNLSSSLNFYSSNEYILSTIILSSI